MTEALRHVRHRHTVCEESVNRPRFSFYNFDRPHGAHGGKTPYEALREKLS